MPIAIFALEECVAPTLEDPFDLVFALVDGASLDQAGVLSIRRKYEHALRITKDWDIRIVRDENDLPTALDGAQ